MSKIDIKYYPTWHDISVEFGFYEDGEFYVEKCNHFGRELKTAYTFDGFNDGEYYDCYKCGETWERWELDSNYTDGDFEYQSWKESQL